MGSSILFILCPMQRSVLSIHMSERLFPKPSPAESFPEEVWLKRTDRSETGREPFFSGRDAEYCVFQSSVESLNDGMIGGGTMIFQGAPGAGKTALMLECMEAVRQHSTPDDPWVAVFIQPDTLKSAVQTVRLIVRAANVESERLAELQAGSVAGKLKQCLDLGRRLYQELSERGVGATGFSVEGKQESADSELVPESVFTESIPLLKHFRLVVFVDESQNIPVTITTQGVMGCLHNPPKEIPLLGAFFGLHDTQSVLQQCGLARFASERVTNLETLSLEDVVESFQRMLGTYFTGTTEEKRFWSAELARLSQGWPQHINWISVAVGQVISANGGQLERHLLSRVLEAGTECKRDYCLGRLAAASQDPQLYKQLADAASLSNGVLSREELRAIATPALEETQESFDSFLTNALHAGLLAPTARLPYHYQIPIPSMSEFLRSLPV